MRSRPIFEIEVGTETLTQCRGETAGHPMSLGFFEGRHLMVWDGVGPAPIPTEYYHVKVVGMTPKQGALVVSLVDHCDPQGRSLHTTDTPQEAVVRELAHAGPMMVREEKKWVQEMLAEVGLTWADFLEVKDAYLD